MTTEGLLMFTLDNKISFNPFELSHDVTPDAIKEAIRTRSYSLGLGLSLRLNEYPLILEALEAIPLKEGRVSRFFYNLLKKTINSRSIICGQKL